MAATKSRAARKPRKSKSTRKPRKSTARASKAKTAEAPKVPEGAGEVVPDDTPVVASVDKPAPPEPAPTTTADLVAQREQARAERRRQRELRKQQPPPMAKAAIENPDPHAPRSAVVPIDKASKRDSKDPLIVPLDDALRWKMEALNLRVDKVEAAVRLPLFEKLKAVVEQKINDAVRANPDCVKARQLQAECLNEIFTAVAPKLPEGYAVAHVRTEQGDVVAEYRPEQAGKLFEVPKG
jgi:hypothetical protein